MRRSILLLLLLCVFCGALVLLSGCNARRSPSVSVVDTIRASKTLHAAYVVYPPFVTKDANTGRLSGYFIDLMQKIADYGKFGVSYEEATWGSMIAGLDSHHYDIVVSGIFPTIQRSFSAEFARPIMYVGLSAAVRSGPGTVQWTEKNLEEPGLRVAVVNGEVGYEYAKQFLPRAKLIVLDTADISRAPAEVLYGRADVAIAESITIEEFAQHNPGLKALFTDDPLEVFGSTFMVRRGDPDWVSFLNTSIDFLQASGFLKKLDREYKTSSGLWRDRASL
jgi:ABC-type amino acid transport substrate-binding protein